MRNACTWLGLASLLLLIAACTQDPAEIVLKGQTTYGRNGESQATNSPTLFSYAKPVSTGSATPAYTTASGTVTQNAGIQSVGVHDLAALAPASGSPTFNTSVKTSPAPANNAWAHTSHFSDAANTPAATPAKPVAQLDHIVTSDSSSKPHKAKTDSIAFMWPVSSKHVLSAFGPKGDGKANDGINIASKEGEPVWASSDGEIVYVGNELQGYGNMVLIKHSGNKTTAYAHLSRATVDKYDRVKQGDIIGYVGTTGNVKEPQLHFAIRDGKDAVDPAKYLSRNVAANQ